MANAVNAESYILRNGNYTPEQIIVLTGRLENLLKLVIKKEIVLEFLIDDATKACEVSDECVNCAAGNCHKGWCCHDGHRCNCSY